MLHAEAVMHLVESDDQRLHVARHQWLQDGDRVVADLVQLLPSPDITTVVCCWPADHPGRQEILVRIAATEVATVLIAGPCEPLAGFVGVPTTLADWSLLRRS
jgi:hypothetical protein